MKKFAFLRLHFVVFLWGFTAIIGKLITAPSMVIVFYRMSLTAVFLWLFTRLIRRKSIKVNRQLVFQLLGVGVIMALHWLCFFQSIKVANVSIALCCLSLSTLFASIIEPFIYKRKHDFSEVIIGFVIVLCITLIFKVEFQYKEGIFFGILTALFGTIFSILNGKLYGKTASENIILYEMLGGSVVITLFLLLNNNLTAISEIGIQDFGLIALLAGVFTAYPMLESVNLMKYISPFTLILTVNLEPIYGILFAFIIFGKSELMSPIFYIASLVMILAIFVNGILKKG
ncbi:MAG: permease [Flavobacteriales bacterium]|nr:MAG: permease [Flavobacteriales bacterium]